MKKIYPLVLILATVSSVHAQQLITVPNDSAEIWANVTDEFEPNDVHIGLVNNTSSAVTITWGMINYSALPQWEVKHCDNNNCYDLLLAPGPYESLTVAAGDTMDMKSQYTAHLITGTGSTNLFAYITGDSANSVVFLNYKANLTYVSGIEDNSADNMLKLFPNPVKNSFAVSGIENADRFLFEVYDLKGAKKKSEIRITSGSEIEVSVVGLPAGEYFLKAIDQKGKAVGISRFNKLY